MKKYLTEFLGTFFLMFTIIWVVHADYISSGLKPSVIGFVLMLLIYIGGPISKAHYNPAATIGFITRKQLDRRDIAAYFIAEFFGAFLAARIGVFLFANNVARVYKVDDMSFAIIGEFIGTFVIVSVIMFVATLKRTIGNKYYGFAIALAVTLMIHAFGSFSGGAFNHAVALGFFSNAIVDTNVFIMMMGICSLAGYLSGLLFNVFDRESEVSQKKPS